MNDATELGVERQKSQPKNIPIPLAPHVEVDHGDAIEIKWDCTDGAYRKQAEHYIELETKVYRNGHVARQIERQKVMDAACYKPVHPVVHELGPSVKYIPQHVLKDGFTPEEKEEIVIEAFGSNVDLSEQTDKHKLASIFGTDRKPNIVLFPPPDATSIVFHSRQGDLFRKREAMIETRSPRGETAQVILPSAIKPSPVRMDSVSELSLFLAPAITKNTTPTLFNFYNLFSKKVPCNWVVLFVN